MVKPLPAGISVSPAPGAQWATQAAWPRTPVSPKQVQPSPRRIGVDPGGGGRLFRVEPVDDRVVHDGQVVRLEPAAGQVGRRGEFRVDQEAPVFVGAAVRRGRLIGPRQPHVDEPFARSQRGRRSR
jgi:hypothetical protein